MYIYVCIYVYMCIYMYDFVPISICRTWLFVQRIKLNSICLVDDVIEIMAKLGYVRTLNSGITYLSFMNVSVQRNVHLYNF